MHTMVFAAQAELLLGDILVFTVTVIVRYGKCQRGIRRSGHIVYITINSLTHTQVVGGKIEAFF
ncbi:hypothetical protein D3C72_544630 [compost metagenome]